jgi:hypothetical protein
LLSQTTAFFQTMVREIDLDAISQTDADGCQLEGRISREQRDPLTPVFEPMRRKMHIPAQHCPTGIDLIDA